MHHTDKYSCRWTVSVGSILPSDGVCVYAIAVGARRIDRLHRNAIYFRRRLRQLGFKPYGHEDSPVVPVLTYLVTKIS